MLDHGLIQGKPALVTEFQVSLPVDIVSTLLLLIDADRIEGLDQWIYATHAAFEQQLGGDAAAVIIVGTRLLRYYVWLNELPKDAPVHRQFAAFISWLSSFTVEQHRELLDNFLTTVKEDCEEEGVDVSDWAAALRTCYADMLGEPQIERLIQLCQNPADFKAQLISTLTRFWEQFYRQEFERNLSTMDRSVTYHRRRAYGPDLPSTFVEVTGRRFPKDWEDYRHVERVIFVPSCYVGPYVMMSPCDAQSKEIIIRYNARATGVQDTREIATLQGLFPPLKALADETRLQIMALLDGRELYAQEIVDQLDISQSAVSRHLALMVTGGLLDVRREESQKYYSINGGTLAALAEALKRFRTH